MTHRQIEGAVVRIEHACLDHTRCQSTAKRCRCLVGRTLATGAASGDGGSSSRVHRGAPPPMCLPPTNANTSRGRCCRCSVVVGVAGATHPICDVRTSNSSTILGTAVSFTVCPQWRRHAHAHAGVIACSTMRGQIHSVVCGRGRGHPTPSCCRCTVDRWPGAIISADANTFPTGPHRPGCPPLSQRSFVFVSGSEEFRFPPQYNLRRERLDNLDWDIPSLWAQVYSPCSFAVRTLLPLTSLLTRCITPASWLPTHPVQLPFPQSRAPLSSCLALHTCLTQIQGTHIRIANIHDHTLFRKKLIVGILMYEDVPRT